MAGRAGVGRVVRRERGPRAIRQRPRVAGLPNDALCRRGAGRRAVRASRRSRIRHGLRCGWLASRLGWALERPRRRGGVLRPSSRRPRRSRSRRSHRRHATRPSRRADPPHGDPRVRAGCVHRLLSGTPRERAHHRGRRRARGPGRSHRAHERSDGRRHAHGRCGRRHQRRHRHGPRRESDGARQRATDRHELWGSSRHPPGLPAGSWRTERRGPGNGSSRRVCSVG
jgi:hypothetical protein